MAACSASEFNDLQRISLRNGTGKFFRRAGNFFRRTGNFISVQRPFLHTCRGVSGSRSVLTCDLQTRSTKWANENGSRAYYGEAFWRAHHEAWRRSDLNQREYCEAEGISLKAFGNWRAKFKAEPQPPARKLLYRRGGLSHTVSHSLVTVQVTP